MRSDDDLVHPHLHHSLGGSSPALMLHFETHHLEGRIHQILSPLPGRKIRGVNEERYSNVHTPIVVATESDGPRGLNKATTSKMTTAKSQPHAKSRLGAGGLGSILG